LYLFCDTLRNDIAQWSLADALQCGNTAIVDIHDLFEEVDIIIRDGGSAYFVPCFGEGDLCQLKLDIVTCLREYDFVVRNRYYRSTIYGDYLVVRVEPHGYILRWEPLADATNVEECLLGGGGGEEHIARQVFDGCGGANGSQWKRFQVDIVQRAYFDVARWI